MSGELRISELGAELAHYGVPGMKWGHRKSESATGGPSSKKKLSRKELRVVNKEGQAKFNQEKIQTLIEASSTGNKVLIKTRLPGQQNPMIVTGNEFITHLQLGGAFDVRMTEVYARQEDKTGPLVINHDPIGTYKKVKR